MTPVLLKNCSIERNLNKGKRLSAGFRFRVNDFITEIGKASSVGFNFVQPKNTRCRNLETKRPAFCSLMLHHRRKLIHLSQSVVSVNSLRHLNRVVEISIWESDFGPLPTLPFLNAV